MAHSLYDSIACFAYWEAMPEENRETVSEFTETVGMGYDICDYYMVGDHSEFAKQKNANRFNGCDLINIGSYSAIYLVLAIIAKIGLSREAMRISFNKGY